MAEFASKGVAGTALGLGIAGTVGLVSQMSNGCGNNGILGGLFGGNHCDCYVTEKENAYSTALAISQSEANTLKETRKNLEALYAETIRTDNELRKTDAKISDGLIQTGNALGVLNAEVACLKDAVTRNREEGFRNLAESKQYTETLVHAEANQRKCGDEKVTLFVEGQLAKKIDGVLGIDSDMINYNRCRPVLEQCSCGSTAVPFNIKIAGE